MSSGTRLLVATQSDVHVVDAGGGEMTAGDGLDGLHPTCLATDPGTPGRAWCGTTKAGVLRTDDGGGSWRLSGLGDEHVTALAASLAGDGVLWAGTEPSALLRSPDGGETWERTRGLDELPSSSEWSFPPKPETHHVRWIACHPERDGHLWLAIEAGALVTTPDGGRTWLDRVPGGPWDTHELAVHARRPDALRVAAGDGYFESTDGGESWASPTEGLEVGYLRSVAIDPGDPAVVVVSASSRPRTAYVAGRSDGRLYRREGDGRWEAVRAGWPDPPQTIAPLLVAGREAGELWAADERGLHRSGDGGRTWQPVAAYPTRPSNLRGLVLLADAGGSQP